MQIKQKISDIIEAVKALITKGRASLDDAQKKSLSVIVRFFALMLAFTIIAGGTAAATSPVVTLEELSGGSISQFISGNGSIMAEDVNVLKIPTNIRINKALIHTGAKVKEGDPVLSYDEAEITAALAIAELDLKTIALNIKEKKIMNAYDGSALQNAENNVDRQNEDYESTVNETNISLSRARKVYIEALEKLDKLEYEREHFTPALGYSSEGDIITGEQIEAAKRELEQARQGYEDAQIAAGKSLLQAKRGIEDAEISYKSTKKSSGQTAAEAGVSNEHKQNEVKKLELEYEKKEELVNLLKNIIENKFVLLSPISGTVQEILMLDGIIPTGEGGLADYMKIFSEDTAFYAELEIDGKKAKNIKVGTKVDITSGMNPLEGELRSISAVDEDGKVKITVSLPEKTWTVGTNVKLKINQSENKYDIVVPLAAVFEDDKGSYVYVLEERGTILGVKLKVVRVNVVVDESDDKFAGVSGSDLRGMKVVISSTKPIKENDTVREEA